MATNIVCDRVLLWDASVDAMVVKHRISLQIVGNHGTVYAEYGPLHISSLSEVHEAVAQLRREMNIEHGGMAVNPVVQENTFLGEAR
jgi:hypothetical protein